ncbi:MAG: RNA pseudouridine synthase [Sedimentisphaerales bacterium]|nr:RNA pseudouridine synthase [Sedimentisphaerales bacterium]
MSNIIKKKYQPKGLKIIYEDEYLLVMDKQAGLLTVGTKSNRTKTAHYLLTDYVKKGNAKSRKEVFVVHRLDQWTSGLLIFAKSEKIMLQLKDQWKEIEKKYVALVHGKLKQKEGIITSYLAESKSFTVYSTNDETKGRLSHTAYKVLKETAQFSLVEINLLTGRKNQIRVHMADRGHPIVGDRKYGKDKDMNLALHSKSISFKHPVTGEQMSFDTKIPDYFNRLMNSKK